MKVYERGDILPVGVYYIPGPEGLQRESFAMSLVQEKNNVATVNYEAFCNSLGMSSHTRESDGAFRAAIDSLLDDNMAVVLMDTHTLDEADIALYGFDGPSQMTSIYEEVEHDS